MISDLYARKSTVDGGRSAARQRLEWLDDCSQANLEPGRFFADPELSASRYAKKVRTDYEALNAHIRSGACQLVSLWEASRGSRDLGEWVAFLDLCRAQGVLIRIFSDGEQRTYDPRVQRDRVELVKMGLDAETETERLATRVRAGMANAARLGRPHGRPIAGHIREYDSSGNFVQQRPDPERAALLNEIADQVIAGVPLQRIANELNDRGIPSLSGTGRWDGGNLKETLLMPAHAGHREHKGKIVKENAWPAIFSAEKIRSLKTVLEKSSTRKTRKGAPPKTALAAVALCDACGQPLHSRSIATSKSHRRRIVCNRRGCYKVSCWADDMENAIDSIMMARLRETDIRALSGNHGDAQSIDAARAEVDELRERLDKFYIAAALGNLSEDGLLQIETKLKPMIEQAILRYQKLTTPRELADMEGINLAAEWENFPIPTKQRLMRHLVDIRLSPASATKSNIWSIWRLRNSRWKGDKRTWGEIWEAGGHSSSNLSSLRTPRAKREPDPLKRDEELLKQHEITDQAWELIHPILPPQVSGRAKWADHRTVVSGIYFKEKTGIPWSSIPSVFGPRDTLWRRLKRWTADGTWQRIVSLIEDSQPLSTEASKAGHHRNR